MPDCPTCQTPLRTIRQREGIYYFCDQCGGRAVTLSQIRRVAGDRFATRLLRQINTAVEVRLRNCPFCASRMKQFQTQDPPLTLDACKPCGAVWFDRTEFEAVPEGASESVDDLQIRGRQALAEHKVERMRQADDFDSPPEEGWKWLPAMLGLPVEMDGETTSYRPCLTWSLSLIIAIVSVWAFFDIGIAVNRFGLIPAEAWRYGGATFATSFFLHAGIGHLLSNLYFFMLFGDNVEGFLGRWRFAVLITLAALTGDCLHILGGPHSTIPCIGASGGISGVITFYALKFPRARLGFLFFFYWRFRWVRIPAWIALVLWLLLQAFGVFEQLHGMSDVSSIAHFGGTAAGFAALLIWRKPGSEKNSELNI